jgi:hypothetical protein
MNLSEFVDGTVAEKAYLAPVFGDVDCASLSCLDISVNGLPVPAIAFSQTASASNSANTNEVNTFGAGVGSLTVPANYFSAGSSGSLVFSGRSSAVGGETLTLRLYGGADGLTQLSSVAIVLPASTTKGFFAEFSFTVRASGAAGVASLFTVADFSQGRNADLVRSCGDSFTANTTTFSTTTANQFRLTSQYSAATALLIVDNLVLTV